MNALAGFLFTPIGDHTRDTSVSAATELTPPTGANVLMLQPLAQNVRYTVDGTTPTNVVGFRLAVGAVEFIPVPSGEKVIVIEETSGAEIQYQWLAMVFGGGNVPAR